MRSEIRSRSTSANSAKSVVMTLVWDVALALDADVLLQRHEGDAASFARKHATATAIDALDEARPASCSSAR